LFLSLTTPIMLTAVRQCVAAQLELNNKAVEVKRVENRLSQLSKSRREMENFSQQPTLSINNNFTQTTFFCLSFVDQESTLGQEYLLNTCQRKYKNTWS
jgi:hypothetical protein